MLSQIVSKHKKKLKKYDKELVLREIIRDTINEMVKDIAINTKKELKKQRIKNIKDIYRAKFPLVCFSGRMKQFDSSIKDFLKQKMYYNHNVLKKTKQGKKRKKVKKK